MPKVLIADKLSPAAVAIFKERGVDADVKIGLSKDELVKIVDQYDGIAIRSATKITADVIKAAKNLKVVGRAGIGVDNVDIPAATAAGVIVMNTPFGNSITTAEHAIALIFALARQLPEADASTQAGKWEKNRFMGVEKVELEELLARADIITLHTPLTDKTRNILSAENLAKTKKGVMISARASSSSSSTFSTPISTARSSDRKGS
jgi:D-3-phosphoglycerate dehydrogenase